MGTAARSGRVHHLQEAKEQGAWLASAASLFPDKQGCHVTGLPELEAALEAKRELWAALHGFESSVSLWKSTALSDLDMEDVQTEVHQTSAQAQELSTRHKHAILARLRDRLEDFEPLMPLLQVRLVHHACKGSDRRAIERLQTRSATPCTRAGLVRAELAEGALRGAGAALGRGR